MTIETPDQAATISKKDVAVAIAPVVIGLGAKLLLMKMMSRAAEKALAEYNEKNPEAPINL